MKKLLMVVLILLLLALAGFFTILPSYVGKQMNAVINPPPYNASDRARELHQTLDVADLHADTLLWNRDLLERGDWGHVDLPRLIEANVALQAFTVVTKTPRGQNIESNSAASDNITLLALAERWPPSTWTSLLQRALYQARRLRQAAADSNGKLTVIGARTDLAQFLERRKKDRSMVAGFLGIEGAHALEGDAGNLDRLYDAGFRMIGITHFFDNEMGGSAHGESKDGLTEEGRKLVKRMEQKRVFVDLAHASPKVIDEVLGMATRPVIVSHSGVRGTCDNRRNLSDDHLKGIARTGGVVGIGFWETAVCGRDAAAIARAIRYTVDLIGVDHVGLGSDNDGAVTTPFDITGVVQITDALLKEGFSADDIRKIMGGNVIRLMETNLPE
ncbi:MAG: dipeptidase [Acidobacteriota bacterium]|nr:MAG: dipeptidase [Acidobacteriota bacterium]